MVCLFTIWKPTLCLQSIGGYAEAVASNFCSPKKLPMDIGPNGNYLFLMYHRTMASNISQLVEHLAS
jgi:hypothetical protein